MGLIDVTVVVATYGSGWWPKLAESRAVPSAEALGVPVIQVHGDTLHDARNAGLRRVDTEWVVHLDADDQLEPGYVEAMAAGTADVRAPSVRYVRDGRLLQPRMPRVAGHTHLCVADCLMHGNWIVVGAAVRTQLVRDIGGWRDFPWSEDYDVWLRCYLAGASIQAVPQAVYRAYVRPDSRNRAPTHAAKLAVHRAICAANGIPGP